MTEEVNVPPSSPDSVSLLEIRTETRLVLKSFLRKTLTVPPSERPGRIGGEYRDHNKYSASLKDKSKTHDNGWDSLDEEISSAEEKKHGFKDLIRKRWRPRPVTIRRVPKDGGQSPHGTLERDGQHSQSEKELTKQKSPCLPHILKQKLQDENLSPSSTSEEEGEKKTGEKKNKKKKKLKTQLSGLLKLRSKKDDPRPQRPNSLPIQKEAEPDKPVTSPSHPPEFYDEVAETLNRIARHSVKKKSPIKPEPPPPDPPKATDKTSIVQQLVHVLCMEGDAMNEKINASPFLRSSLNRLSYPSFAKLLDTCANINVDPPLTAPVSPTLRRVAITMEVSRRVVTATGTPQRLQGYAERYMENFAPWVKSQGGWENIVQSEEALECD